MHNYEIKVTHVGTANRHHEIIWPEGWPVPRVGDEISIPGMPEITHVRHVEWNPEGSDEHEGRGAPFVYVVVGPARAV